MTQFLTFLLFLPLTLFAEEVPDMPRQQGIQTFVMVAIALLFFYFILWRPEQKRRKALEAQRAALKQGDRVVAMGIIGTIIRIDDKIAILKMYDGSKIEVLKGAITEVLPVEEKEKSAEATEK